jgi:hypothetical protein
VALFAAALEPRIRRLATEGALVSYLDVARAPVHQGILDLVVPGVLADFDLPDLAGLARVRPVWIVTRAAPAAAGFRRPRRIGNTAAPPASWNAPVTPLSPASAPNGCAEGKWGC